MLAIIQEIGVIQSVIIAACLGFMLGMLAVILPGMLRNESIWLHYKRNRDRG